MLDFLNVIKNASDNSHINTGIWRSSMKTNTLSHHIPETAAEFEYAWSKNEPSPIIYRHYVFVVPSGTVNNIV